MSPAPTTNLRRVRSDGHDTQITAWALAAGGGDREAAERFVRATYDDVRRFVAHLSADVPGADDLAQETYLRALTSLAKFAGRSCARTWLLSIARCVVIDRYRSAAARPRVADTADWQLAAERAQPRHLPGFDETVAVFDALDTMDPPRRQAFVLTQLLGLSYVEAARVADCPVGTVRSRVARARRDLAAVWQADMDPRFVPGPALSLPPGPVRPIVAGPRRPARHLAALSESSKYVQY
ncbi:sigma-70 family RNA polymerase sigma factor, partial [Streptomyces sp. NPDC058280]|uniref:sigma-70 family RNA polymerase sigma factor n=1 Tax=Streptomyces sp. NPDC058280 TaxID=3346419 RepID=UPI0036DFE2F2